MKFSKSLLAAAVAAASFGANAEIETSTYVDIASQFLDRGQVSGDAAVMAGVGFETEFGVYAGIDAIASGFNEVDYVLGYAGEFGGVGFDIAYADLNFPSAQGAGDAEEILAEVGLGDFTMFYATGLTDGANDDYDYYSLSYGYEDWTFTYGVESAGDPAGDDKYSHVNIDYAFSDQITLTGVVPVDSEANSNAGGNDELQFVVTYSVPLD